MEHVIAEHLPRIASRIGQERTLHETAQTLHFFASGLRSGAVGALHVTCADETEHECAEAFQQGFAHYFLPSLKFARRSPMRLANLGGQYEWGAVRVAEEHFSTVQAASGFQLMVVKINAHVAFEIDRSSVPHGVRVGFRSRYDHESPCCGALAALMAGSNQEFANGLRELMESEGRDRVALLRDSSQVDPEHRALAAAAVSARLQARKAVLDIQDFTPHAPTFFLVLPCVTINRQERDTEIVCGIYVVDGRTGGHDAVYQGLGDDPSAYTIRPIADGFEITDDHVDTVRRGRNHRALARSSLTSHDPPAASTDERLDRIRRDVGANRHREHRHAKTLLRIALPVLAEVAPIPAALLMFAEGAVGIRHAFRIHQLTNEMASSADAQRILHDVHAEVDQLDEEHAQALVELLVRDYSR